MIGLPMQNAQDDAVIDLGGGSQKFQTGAK